MDGKSRRATRPRVVYRMTGCLLSGFMLSACAGGSGTTAHLISVGASPTSGSTGSPYASSAPATPLPAAKYEGAISAPASYPNEHISLEPPGSATPATGWSKAYETCSTGDAICDTSQSPTISLAKASDPDVGIKDSSGQVTKPILNDTLVWLIKYTAVPCAPVGPPLTSSPPAAQPRTYTCTVLNFISAQDGAVLYSVQSPQL